MINGQMVLFDVAKVRFIVVVQRCLIVAARQTKELLDLTVAIMGRVMVKLVFHTTLIPTVMRLMHPIVGYQKRKIHIVKVAVGVLVVNKIPRTYGYQ